MLLLLCLLSGRLDSEDSSWKALLWPSKMKTADVLPYCISKIQPDHFCLPISKFGPAASTSSNKKFHSIQIFSTIIHSDVCSCILGVSWWCAFRLETSQYATLALSARLQTLAFGCRHLSQASSVSLLEQLLLFTSIFIILARKSHFGVVKKYKRLKTIGCFFFFFKLTVLLQWIKNQNVTGNDFESFRLMVQRHLTGWPDVLAAVIAKGTLIM